MARGCKKIQTALQRGSLIKLVQSMCDDQIISQYTSFKCDTRWEFVCGAASAQLGDPFYGRSPLRGATYENYDAPETVE